jgi:hypothetical protein
MNDEKFNRVARNLARLREMGITGDEANFMLGALTCAAEMEEVLDMVTERRADATTKAGS